MSGRTPLLDAAGGSTELLIAAGRLVALSRAGVRLGRQPRVAELAGGAPWPVGLVAWTRGTGSAAAALRPNTAGTECAHRTTASRDGQRARTASRAQTDSGRVATRVGGVRSVLPPLVDQERHE